MWELWLVAGGTWKALMRTMQGRRGNAGKTTASTPAASSLVPSSQPPPCPVFAALSRNTLVNAFGDLGCSTENANYMISSLPSPQEITALREAPPWKALSQHLQSLRKGHGQS